MLRQTFIFVATLAIVSSVVFAAQYPIPVPKTIEDISSRQNEPNYRLPNNTRPLTYNVEFSTNIHTQTDFSFMGTVDITILVTEPNTRSITLHHRNLTIGIPTLTRINLPNNDNVLLGTPDYTEVTNFLVIPLAASATPLIEGAQYILRIPFNGILREDEAGFYRSSYLINGQRKWLATTQFESTDARHGFPCYDEPALRANFAISISHGQEYTALSNMPVESRTIPNVNGIVTTKFLTTPETPTYLIAYVVSDFAYDELIAADNVPHRVYARPNAIHGADFGKRASVNILRSLEEFLNVKYTLPKMDQIAIPDFAAGAMENWGLVTYREPYLLYFANESTFVNERNVATIVAHEYAHQWFGNLVTPKWWTYLWLNEGFATLYEYYATHWVFPEWNIIDTFVSSTFQNVLQTDANGQLRPMTHYVESDLAISRLFDNIAYAKSGSVLRMFTHAFTENSFKKGLNYYLTEMAKSDATEEDLFRNLQRGVREDGTLPLNLNVDQIMYTWTRQRGFPIVHVNRNYENGEITLTQERYYNAQQRPTTDTDRWWIPYNYLTASTGDFNDTRPIGWFNSENLTITPATAINNADWVVFNKQSTGYYRVKYDIENYRLIANLLRNGDINRIHLTSRSQIIDDLFDFALYGRLGYDTVFDVIRYLENEIEYVPWASAIRGLNTVDRIYGGNLNTNDYEKYSKYLIKLFDKYYHDTGVKNVADEPHFKKQSRVNAINWTCRLGFNHCLTETRTELEGIFANTLTVHQNVRGAIICNGMRTGGQNDFLRLFNLLQTTSDSADRSRIIAGIGCMSNSTLLTEYIQSSVVSSESQINYQSNAERYSIFNSIIENGAVGYEVAVQFLIDNLDSVSSLYGAGNARNTILRAATYTVSDQQRSKFDELIVVATPKSYIFPETITSARNTVNTNKEWSDKNHQVIARWIEINSAASVTMSAMILTIIMVISKLF